MLWPSSFADVNGHCAMRRKRSVLAMDDQEPSFGEYGYGPSVGLRVGTTYGYNRAGYGNYAYRPSYGMGYGSMNRVYATSRVRPAYVARRPAYASYGRAGRRCR